MAEPGSAGGVYSDGAGADPATLLQRIQQGDPDAFEAVAREHAPRLFRLAMRFAGRREEAEDLVQETLVRALPALAKFEGRAKLSTYLIRALGNLWKNRLRSKKRSRFVEWFRGKPGDEDETAEFDPPDPAPSAHELLEQRDRAEQVRRAVTRLQPERRWTLLLREVEEMSYEEIAEVTGVAVGTVRSRLARARSDLRQLMETES